MTSTGRLAVMGAALFCGLASTAQAAKGVKKVAPANNASRVISGVVTHVAHKNGSGSFQVRTAHHHKKVTGTATTAATSNPQQRVQLHVTAATHFGHSNGTPASFAALRAGERVRVQATGHNANAVQIMSQHRIRGTFARYRGRTYNPYVYRPYRRPHVIRQRR